MILRELFYYDKETFEPVEDTVYDETSDESPVEYSDTRKTRLTLRQINKVRKAAELHKKEQQEELGFVSQMYGIAANAESGGI